MASTGHPPEFVDLGRHRKHGRLKAWSKGRELDV
jgi:hypothetical protein